jgi:hypothetical protein
MLTVKQLQRLWVAGNYASISRLCLEMRPEVSARLITEGARPIAAAAMIIMRLDELGQAHHPFVAQLIRTLLKSQEADGGWQDPITTAFALKALLTSRGAGVAVNRAAAYLACLQKEDGLWPKEPLRRMPSDPFVSAVILFLLVNEPVFRSAIRLEDALRALNSPEVTSAECEAAALFQSMRARYAWISRPVTPQLAWS